MKRKEILEKKNSKEETVNVSSVLRKDKANIASMKSTKELELVEVQDKIDSYLSNPKLGLDSQFVSLIEEESAIKDYIETISIIEESYL